MSWCGETASLQIWPPLPPHTSALCCCKDPVFEGEHLRRGIEEKGRMEDITTGEVKILRLRNTASQHGTINFLLQCHKVYSWTMRRMK